MVEGKVEIYLSHKEPEYRDNLMWLRPYLDREGYELLYWGAKGWTTFVPCHTDYICRKPPVVIDNICEPDQSEEKLYEITQPVVTVGSCNCETR